MDRSLPPPPPWQPPIPEPEIDWPARFAAIPVRTECRHTMFVAKLIASNGRTMWKRMCSTCGHSKQVGAASLETIEKLGARLLYDAPANNYPIWVEEMQAGISRYHTEKRFARQEAWDRTYSEYRAGPRWRVTKREMVRAKYGDHCCRCQRAPWVHVHHLTYERVGDEDIADLAPVCVRCHQAEDAIRGSFSPLTPQEVRDIEASREGREIRYVGNGQYELCDDSGGSIDTADEMRSAFGWR